MSKGHGGAGIVVVAPTRELAKQIAGEFRKFSKELKTITIYGGVSMGPQIDKLPSADIVVGTPGRLLDLYRQGYLKLDKVKHLVLDECDRMFDMGFIEDVETIIYSTPETRQVLLFSATVSSQIKEVTAKYMNDAVHIRVTPHMVKGKLTQQYYVCPHNQKISLLAHLLQAETGRAIIFCRTKRLVDMVDNALTQNGFKSAALHGGITQARRERVVEDFSQGRVKVVVATDVASRGLHIDDIELVINYNLPEDTETYVHRVGRTARQGKEGVAMTLLDEQEFRLFDNIMHHYNGEIEKMEAKGVKRVLFRKDAPQQRGGPRGQGRGGPRNNQRGNPRGNNRSGPRKSGVSRNQSRRQHDNRSRSNNNREHKSEGRGNAYNTPKGHSLADLD